MDSNDFRLWWDYHRGAYPGLAAWAKSNPDQLDHWERILRQVELHQAKSATDTLVAGDDQPKGYGEHPRWIRRIALAASGADIDSYERRQEGPRVQDDQLVADCWRCMDFGIVSVLSPKCLQRLWNNDSSKGLSFCTLACSCSLGVKKARNLRLCQWKDDRPLFRIETIIDTAREQQKTEWDVARDLLLEYDATRHTHRDFADYGPQRSEF